jgi:hypothetical protein
MGKTKKPSKSTRVQGLINSFATMKANIPGMDKEALIAQIKLLNYTVSEKELQGIVDKELVSADEIEEFIEFLSEAECITVPKSSSGGGGGTRSTTIDSIERAREVIEDPTDEAKAEQVSALVHQVVEIRTELNKLLAKGFSFSIALKNPVKGKETVTQTTDADETPAEEVTETDKKKKKSKN